jgi:succinoglycan biosynthesis transport protein ExoP
VDHFPFNTSGMKGLAAVPAAWHRQQLALEVMRAAWRRRYLVAGVTLLCAALGVGVAARMAPRFPAEAIIELHLGRDAQPMPGGQARSVVMEATSVVLGEARIVRSRVVARRVVEALGLQDDAAFAGQGVMAWLAAGLRRLLDGGGEPASDAAAQRAARAEAALLKGLTVQTDNRSYLISVGYADAAPEVAARIVNAVVAAYLAHRMESSRDSAGRTADWLDGQVRATEAQLQQADARVAAFRDEHRLLELGGQGDTLRRPQLREYGSQLGALVKARVADEARLSRAVSLLAASAAGAVDEFPGHPLVQAASRREIEARQALSDLQARFGPRHPSVQNAQASLVDAEAALAGALRQAVAALRASVETAREGEAELRGRIDEMQVALVDDAGQEAQLRNLQAAASALRERLAALVASRDQAQALRELRVVPASVVVPAQPVAQAAGLNPVIVVAAGFGAGLVLGVVLAALLDRRDRGFRTSGEVVAATELRCLGLAPELSGRELAAVMTNGPADTPALVAFDEAARLVASGIGLFTAGFAERGRIVLVTSTFPGEGRSTMCAGLARTLAMAGRRVLMIDGPPRRFGDVPTGAATAAEPALPDRGVDRAERPEAGALVVLHRGASTGPAVDVFSSTRLAAALDQARQHFDVILVEGPPVMLVADALVLGRLADNVVHVARWAGTKRHSVLAALQRMKEHGVAVDGVVLGRVDTRLHARLGLGDPNALHLRPNAYYRGGAARPAAGGRA